MDDTNSTQQSTQMLVDDNPNTNTTNHHNMKKNLRDEFTKFLNSNTVYETIPENMKV